MSIPTTAVSLLSLEVAVVASAHVREDRLGCRECVYCKCERLSKLRALADPAIRSRDAAILM